VVHCSLGICTPIPVEPSTIPGVTRLARITPEWHRARLRLLNPVGHNIAEIYVDGQKVDEARNQAAQKALDDGMKYLFFLDWDTIPPPDAMSRLLYHLDNHPDYDVAAGLYCSKSQPPWPLLWREWGNGVSWDFTLGEVLTERVVGVPMGCTIIRVSAFERLPVCAENPWFKTIRGTVDDGSGIAPEFGTEDLWFCLRLEKELHGKILMDTGILCEHIDHESGCRISLPKNCLPRNRAREVTPHHKVLHIGCGPVGVGKLPEEFDLTKWKEIRVDVDRETKPDVVASMTDLRYFADASVSAIYSSHTIEHLHPHEVTRAFAEFHRVLLPGGIVLLMTPDLIAVAESILRGDLEKIVYTVPHCEITPLDILYGYSRFIAHGMHYQQHHMGFSAETLKARLEAAGFSDVSIQRQPEAWNLSARATKR